MWRWSFRVGISVRTGCLRETSSCPMTPMRQSGSQVHFVLSPPVADNPSRLSISTDVFWNVEFTYCTTVYCRKRKEKSHINEHPQCGPRPTCSGRSRHLVSDAKTTSITAAASRTFRNSSTSSTTPTKAAIFRFRCPLGLFSIQRCGELFDLAGGCYHC